MDEFITENVIPKGNGTTFYITSFPNGFPEEHLSPIKETKNGQSARFVINSIKSAKIGLGCSTCMLLNTFFKWSDIVESKVKDKGNFLHSFTCECKTNTNPPDDISCEFVGNSDCSGTPE